MNLHIRHTTALPDNATPTAVSTTTDIFPVGHALERLSRPTYSSIQNTLERFDISFIWRTTKHDESRRPHRICFSEQVGDGGELCMPLSAAYLGSPGRNSIFFPAEYTHPTTGKRYEGIDQTALQYMQTQGFLGPEVGKDYILVKDFDEMLQDLKTRNRSVYSVDDLGTRFDPVSANSQAMMEQLNSKEFVQLYTAHGPSEVKKPVTEINLADFRALYQPGRRVFIKTCNTEAAGEGVFPVRTEAEFLEQIYAIADRTRKHSLNGLVVLQPEIVGTNKSFQVLLDPLRPNKIQVVALTDQLIAGDGKSYAGSINHQVNAANLEKIGPAIIDMVDRIWSKDPKTCGFLMCDYFDCPDGKVVLFDPGLRPTGNTPAAMVKLWYEEKTGQSITTQSFFIVDFARRITYSEVAQKLGPLAQTSEILKTSFGVLPWGHNHVSGRSIFTLIAPDSSEIEPFGIRVRELLSQ